MIPTSASVFLGATFQFSVIVANTSNTGVTWSVNGVAGGNSTVGTITAAGLYTAPSILPAQTSVTVEAVSQADASKSSSAAVTIASGVTVGVTPATADVELGAVRQFTASVGGSGNPNREVTWSLSGAGCTGAACGSIDAAGNFTAPAVLPSPETITVSARSVADGSKSGTAAARISSTFTLVVNGPAAVFNGETAQFVAVLTPAPNSHPNSSVTWSVSGPGCSGVGCGTIAATGLYTAPPLPPSPSQVTIQATPTADPSRPATRTIAINGTLSVAVSPTSASVELGQTQAFSATVAGAQDTRVTWDVNGIVGGNLTVGTITNLVSNPNQTTYTAPVNKPVPNQVTVRARSNANPNVSASATVTLFSIIGVALSPTASTRAVNHRETFTVEITRTANEGVEWQVEGIPGGNDTVGRICVAGVQPCQPFSTTQTSGAAVDYLAPAGVPVTNPVRVTAVSRADADRSATALVTVLPAVQVSVQPASVTLAPAATQPFTARVAGTANQDVVWTIAGSACAGPASPCGTISSSGLYTAPLAAPSPNTFSVQATSGEDPNQSATASVTIASGAAIARMLPASLTAGVAGDVLLRVIGNNFAASTPGPGSTILVDGAAKTTTCPTTQECSATLNPGDLAAAGSRTIQVRNPEQTTSNTADLVVVPRATSEEVIPLAAGAPAASGKDLIVVEASTSGVSSSTADADLNLLAVGLFNTVSSTCLASSSPVVLRRPASGTAQFDLCAFSAVPLTPGASFTLTGPTPGDILFVLVEVIAGNFARITLEVAATTQKGQRTLFLENANRDKTAATGAVEVR